MKILSNLSVILLIILLFSSCIIQKRLGDITAQTNYGYKYSYTTSENYTINYYPRTKEILVYKHGNKVKNKDLNEIAFWIVQKELAKP